MATYDRDEATQPGFDLHEWESRWASIEQDLEDDRDAAVSQLAELVEQVLVENGYDVTDPVSRAGDEREVVATYLSAREIAERAEVGAASRSEVELAIDDLRDVFTTLVGETTAQ